MASLILISIWVVLVFIYLYKYMFYKPPNFPPGPPRIPLLGSYIFLLLLNYNCFQTAIERLCKFYKTSVLGMYLGPFPLIITMDPVSVKEVLYKREFDGKPNILMIQLRHPDNKIAGIFFTQGPVWHIQRRFALRHMRDYGFGRRFPDLEMDIRDELESFVELVKNGPKYPHEEKIIQNGNVLVPFIFSICFSNCVLKVLTNERLLRQDQHKILDFATNAFIFVRKISAFGRIYSLLPFLPYICPKWGDYHYARDTSMNMYEIMQKIVDEHIQTYDENHERSFIDLYIKEMKMAEKENNKESSFIYSQLILTCIDFFFPTITAIGAQMSMLIQRLHIYPEIVKTMQQEIDNVIGQGRLPELDDRIHMPFTEATIRECMRIDSILPSGLPHMVLTTTKFQQYDIPKDTIVYTCLRGLHNDKMLWGDPENFRPDRYLDYTGKLSLKKDYSLPFGAGKRLCAGETFSRNMLFVFVATIFQNFNIKSPIGQQIPEKKDNPIGLGELPPDYWVKFEPR